MDESLHVLKSPIGISSSRHLLQFRNPAGRVSLLLGDSHADPARAGGDGGKGGTGGVQGVAGGIWGLRWMLRLTYRV